MSSTEDTIAAIATPLGEGGLAVIRLSGAKALEIADGCFSPRGKGSLRPTTAPTHTIHFGHVRRQGQTVDEVLLSVMRAPRTFTREDVVEITCHGGLLPAKLVLDTLLENGARLAEPGEFTRRAFLNGRIDLTQAEAVADLISSRTELALRAANEQLAGTLSKRINLLRDQLMQTLAHVEAHIDFPDEDIAPDTRDQLVTRLEEGVRFMDELLRTANEGQILRRGIRAAIVGRPNAGKSSLLNQLLGHDRAIVSPVPGTTRDTIEETANIRGLPILFIDTAGLREAGDEVELEGIRRSRRTLQQAELILHVLDASEPFTPADAAYLAEFADKKRILVLNKIDLERKLELVAEIGSSSGRKASSDRRPVEQPIMEPFHEPSSNEPPPNDLRTSVGVPPPRPFPPGEEREKTPEPAQFRATKHDGGSGEAPHDPSHPSTLPLGGGLEVSCLTGRGIERLKDAIKDVVWAGEVKAEMLQVMINSRHQDALHRARAAAQNAAHALRTGLGLELAALDLRITTDAVGEIVGKTATEDLLDRIFSQFCIGK